MDVLIFRDPRESTRKCSLTPLRGRPGVRFVAARPDVVVEGGGRVLLHPDGEELSPDDAGRGLLVIDCAWRRVAGLLARVQGEVVRRRITGWRTAYPRRSRTFEDPAVGLASVEALFVASVVFGVPDFGLLGGYRWGEEFLRVNGVERGGLEAGEGEGRARKGRG